MQEPMNLRPIKPSEKQIARDIRNLVDRKWLSVAEEPDGSYRIEAIPFPR
jgi:hypothetical protein